MTLAIFDLDNTLIAGDSDHLWGDYLVEQNIVDGQHYKETNDRFYQDYCDGRLDILAYLRFSLKVLSQHPQEQLLQWRNEFIDQKIRPILLPAAEQLVADHRERGHQLLIITATNDFVAAPIAQLLGIDQIIATTAEKGKNGYTGDIQGVPSFRQGKIVRLEEWLASQGESMEESWFYSDSHNDLPLLEKVEHPVAVDPDAALRQTALEKGWDIISLRNG